MGSLSGSKSKSNSQASSDVWAGMAPFLTDLYGRGQALMDQYQPNDALAQQGQQAWGNMVNPQGNPYLDQMAGRFNQQLGQLNQQSGGQAALTGGYGGGRQGVAEALNTQNVSDQMGQFYGQQYQQDQNRALGALQGGYQQYDPNQQMMNMLGQYGGLIGGPHNTTKSNSSSSSKSMGVGVGT